MLLDTFAVLLGGATALMPVYAKDILHGGPRELGWLLAAPSIGAVTAAFIQAHRPPWQSAGRALLASVAGYGVVTIAFGLSTNLWLSLGLLVLLGACDNISVVLRGTLVQVLTPDAMRGRVSALNGLFIGTSNELGAFESGTVAQFFGPVVAVVSGGIGTLLVVTGMAKAFPELMEPAGSTSRDYAADSRRPTLRLAVGEAAWELEAGSGVTCYGSSRIQILRKLIGGLGSPCDCSLIADGPCALYDGLPM